MTELDERFKPFKGLDCDIAQMITGNGAFYNAYTFTAFDGCEKYIEDSFEWTSFVWAGEMGLVIGKPYFVIEDCGSAFVVDIDMLRKYVLLSLEYTEEHFHEQVDEDEDEEETE